MPRVVIVVAALVVLALLAAPVIPGRRHEGWCDAVSGTVRWQTTWPFGVVTGVHTDASPLDVRLHTLRYRWVPEWRRVHCTDQTLWGRRTGVEDSTVPPISQMHQILQWYVDASTPDDLRQFADVMRLGTQQQQQAAVDAAFAKELASIAADQPGG